MRKELMQRVRIGLTGLSCVFLLVLLAAAFLGLTNGEADRADTAAGVRQGVAASSAGNVAEAPKDPLAELGVAPGNAPEEPAGPSSTSGTR